MGFKNVSSQPPSDSGSCSGELTPDMAKKHPFFPEITDFTATRNEAIFRVKFLERLAARHLLIDERDGIMISLLLNILLITIPLNALLFVYPYHALGLFYLGINYVFFFQRFVLFMHFSSHRRIVKDSIIFDNLIPNIIGPIFGIPSGFYYMHHVWMHHIENNVYPDDLSSTENYQRDNPFHFLHYLGKYVVCFVQMPCKAFASDKMNILKTTLLFQILQYTFFWIMYQDWPVYTLWAWLIPQFVASTFLMFGNFSQHIFVHPDIAKYRAKGMGKGSWDYNCALTYQVINHPENQTTFNDGYHVTHHINSRLHWSDLPQHFMENLDRYYKADVLVFQNIHFFGVGIAVMLGQWDYLYEKYVHLGPIKKSKEEVIEDLKRRLEPIDFSESTKDK